MFLVGLLMAVHYHPAENAGCFIAIHYNAGLGRAPVLFGLAFIEGGMKYEDASIIHKYNS